MKVSSFKRIEVHNWRQYRTVRIEFHPRLTILTGANGAGKTTLLHLLNRHWGWNIHNVSSPRYSRGSKRYWSGFWDEPRDEFGEEQEETESQSEKAPAGHQSIGYIDYEEAPRAALSIPNNVAETYHVNISPQPLVSGVYVPSHRPLYVHQKVESIPTTVDAKQQIFDVYISEIRNRWVLNQKVRSPNHALKQSLIALATFGYGNHAVLANHDARFVFEGFQEVLRKVMPEPLRFKRIVIQVPDVLLETEGDTYSIDAVSGGVSALIDIAWQVFLYSTIEERFVVVIDEPEAHLHPAMQRKILPNLLDAFPQAQFIVATHNPFVIGSALDSHVYVLRHNEDRKVLSEKLDEVNKAGTANDILRDVLGVDSTTGAWVDSELEKVLGEFADRSLDKTSLEELRTKLEKLGMGRYVSSAIHAVSRPK